MMKIQFKVVPARQLTAFKLYLTGTEQVAKLEARLRAEGRSRPKASPGGSITTGLEQTSGKPEKSRPTARSGICTKRT